MHYAIEIVPFGEFSDPRLAVRLGRAAENAGWNGLFIWDHLAYTFGFPGMDPWVALSAIATETQSIRLGINVVPMPRYRPHMLVQTIATLDRLSQGRVIFCAGLGGTVEEFSTFGETADASLRAAMLDEGLQMCDHLLCGEMVTHQGQFYTAQGVTLTPLPVQKPRPPIWIGGLSQPALRRAARWDGWIIPGNDMEGKMVLSPEELRNQVEYIGSQRISPSPIDVAISGCSEAGERELPKRYADAGATWWLETLFGLRGSPEEMLQRVEAGPPK